MTKMYENRENNIQCKWCKGEVRNKIYIFIKKFSDENWPITKKKKKKILKRECKWRVNKSIDEQKKLWSDARKQEPVQACNFSVSPRGLTDKREKEKGVVHVAMETTCTHVHSQNRWIKCNDWWMLCPANHCSTTCSFPETSGLLGLTFLLPLTLRSVLLLHHSHLRPLLIPTTAVWPSGHPTHQLPPQTHNTHPEENSWRKCMGPKLLLTRVKEPKVHFDTQPQADAVTQV